MILKILVCIDYRQLHASQASDLFHFKNLFPFKWFLRRRLSAPQRESTQILNRCEILLHLFPQKWKPKGKKYLFTSGDDGKLLHFLDLSEDDEFPIILIWVIGPRKRKSHNSSQWHNCLRIHSDRSPRKCCSFSCTGLGFRAINFYFHRSFVVVLWVPEHCYCYFDAWKYATPHKNELRVTRCPSRAEAFGLR